MLKYLVLEVYIWSVALLLLNSLSVFVFTPTWKNLGGFVKSIFVVPFWFIAIFSPKGRKVIFNRLNKL